MGGHSNYTFIWVARRQGNDLNGRIFQSSSSVNWLSGFWSTRQGIAFHNGWLSATNRGYTTDWWLGFDEKP